LKLYLKSLLAFFGLLLVFALVGLGVTQFNPTFIDSMSKSELLFSAEAVVLVILGLIVGYYFYRFIRAWREKNLARPTTKLVVGKLLFSPVLPTIIVIFAAWHVLIWVLGPLVNYVIDSREIVGETSEGLIYTLVFYVAAFGIVLVLRRIPAIKGSLTEE
tara:strand:+ start:60 stop:539 length:480 start_codon:yes stop_codon:yes gene_type:complete